MGVIHLDCSLECRCEEQDVVVSKWLREDDGGQRGQGGIAVVQVYIKIANVVGWCATDHTTL